MTTFVVIYRGHTIADARLIALSADPALVADVTARILQERSAEDSDPVIGSLEKGRREALRLARASCGRCPRKGGPAP
jgi:hypothetical protein